MNGFDNDHRPVTSWTSAPFTACYLSGPKPPENKVFISAATWCCGRQRACFLIAAAVALADDDWAVDQVVVPSNAYVEIKLTGTLNFDCGAFRFGTLFADTRIRGETWTNGRTVFRDDLGLPPSDRP